MSENDEVPCSTHPDAPHGFNRNASHTEDRYVCDCEGWNPPTTDPLLAQMVEALRDALDYVESELASEKESFRGYEHASNIDDIEADIRKFNAVLSAYDARRKP